MKNTKIFLLLTLLLLPIWAMGQSGSIEKQLEMKYDQVFHENNPERYRVEWYRVQKNDMEGACDTNGNEIIAPRHNYLMLFGEGTTEKPHYFYGSTDYGERFYDLSGKRLNIPVDNFNVRYNADNGFEYQRTENGAWIKLGIKLPASEPLGEEEPSRSYAQESELSAILAKSLLTQSDLKKLSEDEDFLSQDDDSKRFTLMVVTNIDDQDDGFYFRCTHELARLGDNWALYEIGRLYAIGKGTPMNMAKAKTCLRAAAKNSKSHGSSEAAELLKALK